MLAFIILFVILWPVLFVVNYWLIYRAVFNIEGLVGETDRRACKTISILHVFGLFIALVLSVIGICYLIIESEKFDNFLKKIER